MGGLVLDLDPRPHPLEDGHVADAGRVHPDPSDAELARLGQHRGARQEGGGGRVAGDLNVERLEASAGLELDPAVALVDPESEGAEQALGVVARATPRLRRTTSTAPARPASTGRS